MAEDFGFVFVCPQGADFGNAARKKIEEKLRKGQTLDEIEWRLKNPGQTPPTLQQKQQQQQEKQQQRKPEAAAATQVKEAPPAPPKKETPKVEVGESMGVKRDPLSMIKVGGSNSTFFCATGVYVVCAFLSSCCTVFYLLEGPWGSLCEIVCVTGNGGSMVLFVLVLLLFTLPHISQLECFCRAGYDCWYHVKQLMSILQGIPSNGQKLICCLI